jgi:hypothetical protein
MREADGGAKEQEIMMTFFITLVSLSSSEYASTSEF